VCLGVRNGSELIVVMIMVIDGNNGGDHGSHDAGDMVGNNIGVGGDSSDNGGDL
jgi:hypothetical protein